MTDSRKVKTYQAINLAISTQKTPMIIAEILLANGFKAGQYNFANMVIAVMIIMNCMYYGRNAKRIYRKTAEFLGNANSEDTLERSIRSAIQTAYNRAGSLCGVGSPDENPETAILRRDRAIPSSTSLLNSVAALAMRRLTLQGEIKDEDLVIRIDT